MTTVFVEQPWLCPGLLNMSEQYKAAPKKKDVTNLHINPLAQKVTNSRQKCKIKKGRKKAGIKFLTNLWIWMLDF